MVDNVAFENLNKADLIVDAEYKGGQNKNIKDEVQSKLLGMGNAGGIRFRGSLELFDVKYATLFSTMNEANWPDEFDEYNGLFKYYGDNKKPGKELHDTPKKGNKLFKECFDRLHTGNREEIPPFFIFEKAGGRDLIFRGLAVPGNDKLDNTEDLIAIWKSKDNKRFQNYKATFSILNIPRISRAWMNDLICGDALSENCPVPFKNWVLYGKYDCLTAEKVVELRGKDNQLPKLTTVGEKILMEIFDFCSKNPVVFEYCAVEIARLMDKRIISCDVTRPSKDGGRDAIGKYRIGHKDESIFVEFFLEAKCYKPYENSVGVKEMSRLISRIRNRQFGILVTTSFVSKQAYEELKEDGHPIIIISGNDIVNILRKNEVNTVNETKEWLKKYDYLKI